MAATRCSSADHSSSAVVSLASRSLHLGLTLVELALAVSICCKRRSAVSSRFCSRSSIFSSSVRRRAASASISLRRCTSSSLMASCICLACASASARMRASLFFGALPHCILTDRARL
jgi:hypothetical protein